MKFNSWSKKRIEMGIKRLTSRKEAYPYDKEVEFVTPKLPWWFIRDFLYRDEGAESPEELQRIMNRCQRRKTLEWDTFHVHVLKKKTESKWKHNKQCPKCGGRTIEKGKDYCSWCGVRSNKNDNRRI